MKRIVKKLKTNFLTNLKTIIQATLFSIIIWFFISIQIFPDITLHISDIEVKYEPTALMNEENLRVTSIDTKKITVQVEGKRYQISELSPEDFKANLDLSGIYESGEYSVDINVSLKDDLSDNCKILTESLTAKVKVVKIISKEIEVTPNINGLKIVDGMQIEGEVTVSPSTVIITGEERLINSIGSVEAGAISDEPLSQTTDITSSLTYFSTTGAVMANPSLTANESEFVVSIPIYKVKTLPVNVKFTNCPSNFDLTNLEYRMSVDEITIASPDTSVDNLEVLEIGEISLSALTLKDLQGGVALPVNLPEGYKNISGNKTITVYFPNAESYGQLGFTALSDNISIINAPANYNVELLTNELTVNVVGLSTYIQEMTSADIYATVNLIGLELSEGTKSVSVTVKLAGSGVKAWVTGEEYKVELQIASVQEDVE